MIACLPGRPRSLAAAAAAARAPSLKPREVLLAFEHQRIGLLVGQNILAEGGAELGQPFADSGDPRLGVLRQAGAGAAEGDVIALQDPRLLGRETERIAPVPQRVDAGEQGVVKVNAVAMGGEPRRHLPLDRHQGVVRVGAGQRMKHRRHPVERRAAALQRHESCWRSFPARPVRGDGIDFRHRAPPSRGRRPAGNARAWIAPNGGVAFGVVQAASSGLASGMESGPVFGAADAVLRVGVGWGVVMGYPVLGLRATARSQIARQGLIGRSCRHDCGRKQDGPHVEQLLNQHRRRILWRTSSPCSAPRC